MTANPPRAPPPAELRIVQLTSGLTTAALTLYAWTTSPSPNSLSPSAARPGLLAILTLCAFLLALGLVYRRRLSPAPSLPFVLLLSLVITPETGWKSLLLVAAVLVALDGCWAHHRLRGFWDEVGQSQSPEALETFRTWCRRYLIRGPVALAGCAALGVLILEALPWLVDSMGSQVLREALENTSLHAAVVLLILLVGTTGGLVAGLRRASSWRSAGVAKAQNSDSTRPPPAPNP